MNKSNSAMPETTPNTNVVSDWDLTQKETRELQNKQIRLSVEKQEWESSLIKNDYSNNALKDKMESARRNITEISRIYFANYEKGNLFSKEQNNKMLTILMQNIETLSEIEKFKL